MKRYSAPFFFTSIIATYPHNNASQDEFSNDIIENKP